MDLGVKCDMHVYVCILLVHTKKKTSFIGTKKIFPIKQEFKERSIIHFRKKK